MKRFYQFCWMLSWPFVSLIYPRKTYGREHVPDGPALVCGNHSSMLDPFFVAYGCGKGHHLHFMAKVELFKIPVLRRILRGLGAFPVDREGGGAMAVKGAMKLLKAGEKVAMFPEGTRVSTEEESQVKAGAVRLAVRMDVPIVPAYVPRQKRVLRQNPVIIGEAYHLDVDRKTATPEDYERLAEELMDKIRQLKAGVE